MSRMLYLKQRTSRTKQTQPTNMVEGVGVAYHQYNYDFINRGNQNLEYTVRRSEITTSQHLHTDTALQLNISRAFIFNGKINKDSIKPKKKNNEITMVIRGWRSWCRFFCYFNTDFVTLCILNERLMISVSSRYESNSSQIKYYCKNHQQNCLRRQDRPCFLSHQGYTVM